MSHLPTPSLDGLKMQAKALRTALANTGKTISHSQSLELVAQQLGHKDWNTLHASLGNHPQVPYHVGQSISGTYLSQPFKGRVLRVQSRANQTHFGLTIRFDTPVDVIRFEGMSNLRRQVKATVGPQGTTNEKTSDGVPHLVVTG